MAAGALAPLAVHWLAGRTLVWFDTQRLYAPERWIVDEALRAFRLPLWNPFMGTGVPLFADAIHGVLHPVSVLTAWLGTARSADLLIGGYVACAAVGAAALARDLGASRSAGVVAGLVYGMSGYVLSMSGNLVFLAGAGSLPFCVAGLRRFAVEARPAGVAAGVLGTAVLALSGDMQAVVVGGMLGLLLAWEGGGLRGVGRAIAAGCAGVLVAGVQIFPSAVNVLRSARAGTGWTGDSGAWALGTWRLPELIVPGLLRGDDPVIDPVYAALAGPGGWPGRSPPSPFAQSISLGLVPVALAVLGLARGRRGWMLGGAAAFWLWVALGPALGASDVLSHVPVWRMFRYAEKLVAPVTLSLALLAALGVDVVAEARIPAKRVLAVAAALALVAGAAALASVGALAPALASEAQARCARGAWHVAAGAGALGVILGLRGRLREAGTRAALIATVWCGLAVATPLALHPGVAEARLRAPTPALTAPDPGPRIITPFAHEPVVAQAGLDWIDQAAVDQAAIGYPAYNVRGSLDSIDHYLAMEPRRLDALQAALGAFWFEASRRYAVTHVLAERPLTDDDATADMLATRGGVLLGQTARGHDLWALPSRPWAHFARAVRVLPDEAAALAAVKGAAVGNLEVVAIEGAGAFGTAPGRVLSVARGLETLRVEAESTGEGTLVLADAWWPGWSATLDGDPVTIYPADALVRAVRWPTGRHVLEMEYRPAEVRLGLLASAAGGLLLLGWMAALRRRPAAAAATR